MINSGLCFLFYNPLTQPEGEVPTAAEVQLEAAVHYGSRNMTPHISFRIPTLSNSVVAILVLLFNQTVLQIKP
jgi:hypothetical protein